MFWYEKILNEQSEMETISSRYALLKWSEDYSQKRSYILTSYNKIIGSLNWENSIDSFAYGEVCGKKFYLNKKGFFKKYLLIREAANPDVAATLNLSMKNQNELIVSGNERIFWRRKASWKNEWEFFHDSEINERHKTLMSFNAITSFVKSGCFVIVRDISIEDETLAKMLLLGIYFIVNAAE